MNDSDERNILPISSEKIRESIFLYSEIYRRGIVPAEQQPSTRPSKCFGVLVSFIMIHPRAEPNTNVPRILTGMNHLSFKKP